MTDWQPDWKTLETTARVADRLRSTRRADHHGDPGRGMVSIALRAKRWPTWSARRYPKPTPLSGPLVIAVDTLEIAAGDTVIAAPGVDIKAQAVVIDGVRRR